LPWLGRCPHSDCLAFIPNSKRYAQHVMAAHNEVIEDQNDEESQNHDEGADCHQHRGEEVQSAQPSVLAIVKLDGAPRSSRVITCRGVSTGDRTTSAEPRVQLVGHGPRCRRARGSWHRVRGLWRFVVVTRASIELTRLRVGYG
jgi:hypothetical protein